MENYSKLEGLSEISSRQWDYVTQDNLTAREAVEFLRTGMQLRTFPEIMKIVCGDRASEEMLIAGLSRQDPEAKPDSVRRKVRNWFSGKAMPGEREDAYRICFALELPLEETERMLNFLTDQGIHYRDTREMAYAYCLRNGLDYGHARSLADSLSSTGKEGGSREPATQFVKQAFSDVKLEEDLFTFVLRNRPKLGSRHNTAYTYFCKMLDLLTGEDLEGENRYSMEYVADTYLRMNVPLDKKTSGYTDVQKMVKKYWPGARSIKAMKAGTEDVSRKTLLLLYLVTGGSWDGEYDEMDESYITPSEFLVTHCKRMNRMLMECGMRRIDPRSVFDYLVLYCLRPEDEEFMSDRMAALAAEIFEA